MKTADGKETEIANELNEDEYQCMACNEVFTKGWSDKEALKEYEENFKQYPDEEKVLVCDDCYKLILEHHRNR